MLPKIVIITFNFFFEKLESWVWEKIYQGRPLDKFSLPKYFAKE
jgi:hypothetical protein